MGKCNWKRLKLPPAQWTNSQSKRMSQHTSRKRWTRSTTQHGMLLLDAISGAMSRTKPSTSFTFTLDKWQFCYSNRDKMFTIQYFQQIILQFVLNDFYLFAYQFM